MKSDLSVAELEKRMRPRALSDQGFLGPHESLEAVIAGDCQSLRRLGVSPHNLAGALAGILQRTLDQRDRLLRSDYAEYRRREVRIPNLYEPESVPHYRRGNLPATDVGYLLDEKYHVFIAQWRGMQDCPWGCEYDTWGSFNFLILNRASGESATGPGLIVHLIREHEFFEGKGSPYRTDPVQLVRVLEINRNA